MKRKNGLGLLLAIGLLLLSGCGASPAETPESTATPQPEPTAAASPDQGEDAAVTAAIGVDYADDEALAAYDLVQEYVDSDSEYQEKVIFTTDTPVTDFKFLQISYVDIDENGDTLFSVDRELYTAEELSPQSPVVIYMEFAGLIPTRGISYVDGDGTVKYYAVQMSGKDGSLLLIDITV